MYSPSVFVEAWIAHRMGRRDLFCGVTTPDDRREILRRAITETGLADRPVGMRRDGTQETWAQMFERLYGCPL
jgi:hypothetical protein